MDWRRELLQAVRSVFDSERKCLHAQLQDVMATNTGIDYTSLLKHLEMLLQKQVRKLFPVNKNTGHHMVSYPFLCDSASVCVYLSYPTLLFFLLFFVALTLISVLIDYWCVNFSVSIQSDGNS